MIIFVIFQFYNCAELLNGKDDSKDKDNLTALGLAFLVGAGSCPSTEISAQPTNGTAYDFTKCSGSVASALGSAGFSGSNVSLVSGIAGTSATSTIITNASRLSSTGGEKKASIEITYVLSASDSTLDVIMPSSTSFTGPTFQISTTDIKKKNPSGRALDEWKYQRYMQDYLACVASVDENVGRLLDYLDKNKLSENTLVVYTGDQGMYLGENGWFDKRWIYDVSMQAPLLIRWPGQIKVGTVNHTLTQTIDYAPTLLGAAGIATPDFMQGINLVPLITRQVKTIPRNQLYYHFYEYKADHTVLPHLGIRGERYKLAYFYTVEEWELYDLKKDPAEQTNLIRSAKHQAILQQLKADLLKLRNLYDDHEKAGELN